MVKIPDPYGSRCRDAWGRWTEVGKPCRKPARKSSRKTKKRKRKR